MNDHLGDLEQLILLALLRLDDNAYGVTIRQELDERAGRDVSLGAIYTTLERLERKGLVASRIGEPTAMRGGRRKKFYRLRPAGARALDRSYSALQRMSEGLETVFRRLGIGVGNLEEVEP